MSNQTTQTQSLSQSSPLDQEPIVGFIKDLIGHGETNASVVKALWASKYRFETTEKSIRRFRKRHGLEVQRQNANAGYKITGDEGEITSAAHRSNPMDDPDAMLRERGLDPEEWIIVDSFLNEWDGPSAEEGMVTYHQLKLHLKRKKPLVQIVAPRTDGWKAPKIKKPIYGKPQIWVICGDQQAPYQNPQLHEAFCSWLASVKPDHGISLGDTFDFPTISKHRLDPQNTSEVNECLQAGYDLLRDYRTSSLDTKWQILPGNHCERLQNLLLDKPVVTPLFGVKQVDTPESDGQPVITVPHLLRLDELGIEYVDPKGPYALGQINISNKLAVRHGWIVRQGSGTSALATLDHLGYSIITGHTHRQGIVYKTVHDIDGEPETLTAAESGCMCRIDQKVEDGRKFPNFTVLPDWQNGYCTATVYPDGTFRIDNATFVTSKGKGTLLWRGERYGAHL